MKVVIKKRKPVTTYETSRSDHREPKIWRGKNGRGVYMRVDEETRFWFSNDVLEAMSTASEGDEADGDED